MNERQIQILLMSSRLNHLNHVAAMPNSTMLLRNEADLITVTRAGLVHEFEIKISRSDYNRDFTHKETKHWFLKGSFDKGNRSPGYKIANYFWFVTYGFEIEPPEYCGWIEVYEYEHAPGEYGMRERIVAPRLHMRKWDDKKVAKIARLLSFRLLTEYENEEVRS